MAVGAQQHGMVCLDEGGQVVRPALLWNDTRSAKAATDLNGELGGAQAWAEATGSVPVASFTVTKLRWLAAHEPDHAKRTATVMLPHDWLTWRLSGGQGDPVTDPGDAALGVGARPGDVVVSIGTSGTVFAVHDTATADPSGIVAGFADATGRYLPLVSTLNAARVLEAAAALLGVDLAGLDDLALAAPPGADRVVLVPYFEGERTPNRPADHARRPDPARPSGLRRRTRPRRLMERCASPADAASFSEISTSLSAPVDRYAPEDRTWVR
jgi:xylulokinase